MTNEREQPSGGDRGDTFDDVGDEAIAQDAASWEHPVARDGFVKEAGSSDAIPSVPLTGVSGNDTIDPQRPEQTDDEGDERRRRAGTYST